MVVGPYLCVVGFVVLVLCFCDEICISICCLDVSLSVGLC